VNPVKTVDVYTCREILRIRSGVEQCSSPDGSGEYYWAELLRDCAESDALEATWAHYRTTSRSLLPADVLRRVAEFASPRLSAAEGRGGRLLLDRALEGWDPDRLVRWKRVFDTEVGRGAHVDDARDVADGVVAPGAHPAMAGDAAGEPVA